MYFSYKMRGLSSPKTISTVIESFFYLHLPADNPVFWTLAMEAQYYILIGILYLFIVKRPEMAVLILVPISIT
ncbi:hypothetical protein GCM10027185_18770 [Spirosoma pulveris]